MWWDGEVVDAFVGATHIVLWRGAEPLGEHMNAQAWPALVPALRAASIPAGRWSGAPLRVWLSGAWARPFVLPAISGLGSWDEALVAAQARVADETGWTEPTSIWLDGLPRQDAALAVAVPQALLAGLQASAGEAGVRLQTVRPWWAGALDEARRTQASFELLAAEDPDSLVLLSCQAERWREASAYAPKPIAGRAEAAVHRRATAQGIAEDRIRRMRLVRPSAELAQNNAAAALAVDSLVLST